MPECEECVGPEAPAMDFVIVLSDSPDVASENRS